MSEGQTAPRRSVQWLVWTALAATIIGITIAFVFSNQKRADPTANVASGEGTTSLDQLRVITLGLPSFTLTNQLGAMVTPASLSNNVAVVCVIFTRCAGPCPEMTRRMGDLQRVIPPDLPVKLVTFTTDPEYDTPEVLKRYAARYNANGERWWFLTGNKSDMALLAREGLGLVAQETKPEGRVNDADLFVHSTLFVLLDKKGRLRGSIESTEPHFDIKVLQAVRKLTREP
jgi:cytochrome oxidase Cu insertion factor (SCO1/SenC/PrrC family)